MFFVPNIFHCLHQASVILFLNDILQKKMCFIRLVQLTKTLQSAGRSRKKTLIRSSNSDLHLKRMCVVLDNEELLSTRRLAHFWIPLN